MLSVPAMAQFMMPSVPWAWAATFLPRRWASWTRAVSVSAEYWARRTLLPGVRPPPVAHTLTQSTPMATTVRTAFSTSSSLSALIPM